MEVATSSEIQDSYSIVLSTILKTSNQLKDKQLIKKIDAINFDNKVQKKVFELFQYHAHVSESISPGSYEVFLDYLLSKFKAHEVLPFPLSKKNSLKIIESFSDSDTKSLIFEALILAGLEGKIILSKEFSEHENILEITSGCFFPDIRPAFEIDLTKFFGIKLIPIDGYIESISEIHRVLENAASLKETIILFVRGLSNEVLHTLKVNYDRKSMVAIPVVVKFDLDGANTLNDIAVTSGCDVVSSIKGQLMNSIDINDYPRIQSIDLSSSGVLIENSCKRKDIDFHIKTLQKKILEAENDATVDALTKRIQCLGTNRVTIKLFNDNKKIEKIVMIDRALKAIKMASTYGVVEYKGKYIPASSLFSGEYFSKKFKESMSDIGAMVI